MQIHYRLRLGPLFLLCASILLLGGGFTQEPDNWTPEPRVSSAVQEEGGDVGTAQSSGAAFVNGEQLGLGTSAVPANLPPPNAEANERQDATFVTPRAPDAVYREGPPQGEPSGHANIVSGAPAFPRRRLRFIWSATATWARR